MKRAVLAALFLSLVVAMASLPASADSLFTTLGPGGSYSGGGWEVSGSDWSDEAEGNLFTLSSASTVSDAILALASISGPDTPVDVYIESDNAGSPGSVLATLTQVGTIPLLIDFEDDQFIGGGLVTFTCSGVACDLAAGNYWLVATATNSGAYQEWLQNYNNVTTNLAQDSSGSPTGLTFPPTNPNIETAFQIDGSESFPAATPEPSSFPLLGSGLLGLAGLVKRKLTA